MNVVRFAAATLGLAMLSGCVAPVGPVQVTRFHAPELASAPRGTIAVEPAPGTDGRSLEWQTYSLAVQRQLTLLGYREVPSGQGSQVAQMRVSRAISDPSRRSGPVSVGVGGSTGSYGSGIGLGLGINLGGGSGQQVVTELGVMIRDRASARSLWEGRASFAVDAKSPLASTDLAAPKMAEALFGGFPGQSGETIEVK
ncbi:hypothetical protein B0I00_2263 [Novosphingobium kunmingense]|uniref:DUF4136 domain-containing protein n=1 Tax=Novosphingobium kunmingense TaxID=1211806 RepID=A0A2N0H6U6_9SPHN|nr:hypothetical protein [Novosphingobium kunmingense]PKB14665.1 hypothetical protein B0I00_2263 [Novosphingobium kunmingense]